MEIRIHKKTGLPVKILGQEEGKLHIEFPNGACLLVSEDELEN